MRSFLQTQDWLDFQKHIGRKTWVFNNGKIKANIIQHDLPFGKNYLYIPHGPEINFGEIKSGLKNEVDNFLTYLKGLGKENKSIFVKMEPVEDVVIEVIYRKSLKYSNKSIQPTRTVLVDLNFPEAELLERMRHKTRYNINLASRKNLVFKELDDIEMFWKLLCKTAKRDQFQTHDKNYYFKLYDFFRNSENTKTEFFVVEYEGKVIAAALIMFCEDTAYYLHGAMDRDYKELMAPYFLHWEIIKHAKSTGHRYYDFWGIDAKRWPGVTRFKLGFGGREVEYPGSFDLPVSKIWYLIYRIVRKLF